MVFLVYKLFIVICFEGKCFLEGIVLKCEYIVADCDGRVECWVEECCIVVEGGCNNIFIF